MHPIRGHVRDLGGLTVRRLLPSLNPPAVGPFVFFDHLGPVEFGPGQGMDVRPHPHIGLATVTWLFAGSLMHRDSLGTAIEIRPGEVNWMTAGRGIVHSERTPAQSRSSGSRLHAIQTWVALPRHAEQNPPDFQHFGSSELPVVNLGGARMVLIAGVVGEVRSPVRTASPTLMLAGTLAAGTGFTLTPLAEERAVYLASGAGLLDGQPISAGTLWLLPPLSQPHLRIEQDSEFMLIGGAPLDGPRRLDWNFVSSSEDLIVQARADWTAGRFAPVPGETELIPLPERKMRAD